MEIAAITLIILLTFVSACNRGGEKNDYYTESDFEKVNKIDIHCHINTTRTAFMEQAISDNFRILTVNTNAWDDITIYEQEKFSLYQINQFPRYISYLTTFTLDDWDDEGWHNKTITLIKESIDKGAIGVKVWKNIGMVEKDKNGEFIMIDDPKFDPVFSFLEDNGIPLYGHLGEPKNCWLPIEEMTVNNDKKYFKSNPEYHMYLHPEFPSYEDQLEARDHMLEKHPNLIFVGAHLGSMEWSIDLMTEHLEQFPNMTLEMAARICHIAALSQKDWDKVRNFIIKYQDRIMYGTDNSDSAENDNDPKKLKEHLHNVWLTDWKFFTTDESITMWEVDGEIKGLKLPREIIDKIYFKNAEKLFPKFKKMKT